MREVVDGEVPLDPVHSVRERATKHSCIQYQNVEGEMTVLKSIGKFLDTVQ